MITLPRLQVPVTEPRLVGAGTHLSPVPDAVDPRTGLGAITVGRQRVGISVPSAVSVLREKCRRPLGVIQRYLKGRYGLHLSVGELVALVRRVAVRGLGEYLKLPQATPAGLGVTGRH